MEPLKLTIFKMKWQNRCRLCGRVLPEGTEAGGHKNPVNEKWQFYCMDCIENNDHLTTKTKRLKAEEVALEDEAKAEAGEMDYEALAAFIAERQAVKEEVEAVKRAAEPMAPKKTGLEAIRENAKWAI